MTKTIIANSNISSYFQKCHTSGNLSLGLILGQTCEDRDYIVHLAKTSVPSSPNVKKLNEINDLQLADHAKQATKMLPGGMYVLGIFIVSESDLITSFPPQLKTVIHKLNKSLSTDYLYGSKGSEEKIILNYSTNAKQIKCKLFDPISSNVRAAELKFSDDIEWVKLECKYEIQKNYCWEEKKPQIDLKEQMNVILRDVHKNLKSSVILFDGEFKSEDESVESIGKKKKTLKSGRSSNKNQNNRIISVNILESNDDEISFDAIIKDINNQMKVVGQISSTVWMNPLISYKNASNAIIEDILRSLSTRLEMHCDSLIEEEHKEDSNSIHEPPRRVMIAIPGSEITVSDYLFPGEGAEEAKNSVEEILDIKLSGSLEEIQEVEGSSDLTNYGGNISQIVEGKIPKDDKDSHKLFIIGSIFALMVLIISIMVHFIMKNS